MSALIIIPISVCVDKEVGGTVIGGIVMDGNGTGAAIDGSGAFCKVVSRFVEGTLAGDICYSEEITLNVDRCSVSMEKIYATPTKMKTAIFRVEGSKPSIPNEKAMQKKKIRIGNAAK